jgi:hypothetical protein
LARNVLARILERRAPKTETIMIWVRGVYELIGETRRVRKRSMP